MLPRSMHHRLAHPDQSQASQFIFSLVEIVLGLGIEAYVEQRWRSIHV